MDLDRLRVFLQIVDSGSMSAAARVVHLTQPALSRTLKLLEDEVGVQLFDRRGRALVLTAGGRALVPRGRALLAESERVAREVGRSAQRSYFDVRLGTVDSVATYLLPELVPAETFILGWWRPRAKSMCMRSPWSRSIPAMASPDSSPTTLSRMPWRATSRR